MKIVLVAVLLLGVSTVHAGSDSPDKPVTNGGFVAGLMRMRHNYRLDKRSLNAKNDPASPKHRVRISQAVRDQRPDAITYPWSSK